MLEFWWNKLTLSPIHSFIHLKYHFNNTITTDLFFTVEVLYLEDEINRYPANVENMVSS